MLKAIDLSSTHIPCDLPQLYTDKISSENKKFLELHGHKIVNTSSIGIYQFTYPFTTPWKSGYSSSTPIEDYKPEYTLQDLIKNILHLFKDCAVEQRREDVCPVAQYRIKNIQISHKSEDEKWQEDDTLINEYRRMKVHACTVSSHFTKIVKNFDIKYDITLEKRYQKGDDGLWK